MCYHVYISTNSPEDLSKYNSDLVKFEKLSDLNNDLCTVLLDFPNRWYVGSRSGCSCSFHHLMEIQFGFSGPVDWDKEEQEDIDATGKLYSRLVDLVCSGHQVDLIDSYQGARPEDIATLEVSLDDVSITAFRMFENHKFILKKKDQTPAP